MAGMLIVEDESEDLPLELAAMVEVLLVLQMQYWQSLGVATHDTISSCTTFNARVVTRVNDNARVIRYNTGYNATTR